MDKQEMIEELEEILDAEEGTLEMETVLADLEEWDSLSKLSLIATAKQKFKKEMTADDIKTFETVGDIVAFLN